MDKTINPIQYDLYRMRGKTDQWTLIRTWFSSRIFRRIWYFRKYQGAGPIGKKIISLFNHFLFNKMSLELPWSCRIGNGILFLHPYSITLNSSCVIGDNCTILKGATIGNSKTGRPGSPIIGNNVYIGMNSTIVGGITIGDNVLIAANTFVNFDVPAGKLVLGSPGVIHAKQDASAPYIIHSILNLK